MKWAIITFSLAVIGIILLNVFGGSLVSEITQEVALDAGITEVVARPEIGKKAPYFELLDLSGTKKRLSDLAGKPAVLVFWTTWNPEAVDQIKILDDFLRKDSNTPFKMFIISSQEDKTAVANFLRRGGYDLPVLLDEKGSVSDLYGARVLPVSYFLDSRAFIREIFTGILNSEAISEKSYQASL